MKQLLALLSKYKILAAILPVIAVYISQHQPPLVGHGGGRGPAATPTPRPTATPAPTATPTATPAPTAAPTATPAPTIAPTPAPTAAPVSTPSSNVSSGSAALYRGAACDVRVGDGSSDITIDSSVAKSGQVICIRAGNYGTISVNDLSSVGNPIVIQNEGLVQLDGDFKRMYLSNLKNIVISGAGTNGLENGIVFKNNRYRGISFAGNVRDVVVQNMDFIAVQDYNISWDRPQNAIAYDGTVNSIPFYNVKLLRMNFSRGGKPVAIWGVAGATTIAANIEVAYFNVKDVPAAGSFIDFGHVYGVDVHHNSFIDSNNELVGHPGALYINGDGKFHHNLIKNCIGNGARIWPKSLGTAGHPGKFEAYNNIFLDSHKYNPFEVQPFESDLNVDGKTTYTDVAIYNNTAGNFNSGLGLPSGVTPWTGGFIDTYATNGGRLDVYNNLVFNVLNPQGTNRFVNGQNVGWPANLSSWSNNLYFDSSAAAGLSSPEGKPNAGSAVIGAAKPGALDDYLGIVRHNPSDVGAIEH